MSSRSLAAAIASTESANSVTSVEGALRAVAHMFTTSMMMAAIGQATCDRLGLVGEGQTALERLPYWISLHSVARRRARVWAVGLGKRIERSLENLDPVGIDRRRAN